MTQTTLARPIARFVSAGLGIQPVMYKKDNGNFVVEREAVFRTGTFRDSTGMQNTWDRIHLDQMVANFNYLRDTNVFRDIPVRDGHPGWIVNNTPGTGGTVGWHSMIAVETMISPVDGQEYDYLLVDYELTEPYAVEKRQRGTWRNRSSEILTYLSNAEAEFWPVYGGFAFVDIPAVEGLNFTRESSVAGTDNVRYFVMLDKEINVTTPAPGTPAQPPSQPASPATPAPSQPAQPTVPSPTNPSQPAQHGGSQPFMFTVNGQPTSDFSAVQAHILGLEGFRRETVQAARADFVNSLVANGLVLNTEENVTNLTNLANSMNDEQFAMWRKGYEGASQPALLGRHIAPAASTNGVPGSQAAGAAGASEEVETAKQIVAYHRSIGTDSTKLKSMDSYRKLVAAGIEQA